MNRLIQLFSLLFLGYLLPGSSFAQEDQGYALVEYMKVKPGMGQQYLECEAVWKKIHQNRLEMGLISGWDLQEVLYPRGTHTEYDYITITKVENWDALNFRQGWTEETWERATKGLSEEEIEMADQAEMYREIVKAEIWTAYDVVMRTGDTRPRIEVENFMRIPANGWDAWLDMEMNMVKPVHQKSVEMGTRAGWMITTMVLPRGDELPYQASTLDFYESWADMDQDESAAWEAVHPDLSDRVAEDRINGTRTLVRTEVRMLIDYVE